MPKKWEFPQASRSGRRKKPQPEGEVVSRKAVSHGFNSSLSPQMGLWWAEPHLHLHCLDLHILGLSVESQFRSPKSDFGSLLDLFVPVPSASTMDTSSLSLLLAF